MGTELGDGKALAGRAQPAGPKEQESSVGLGFRDHSRRSWVHVDLLHERWEVGGGPSEVSPAKGP